MGWIYQNVIGARGGRTAYRAEFSNSNAWAAAGRRHLLYVYLASDWHARGGRICSSLASIGWAVCDGGDDNNGNDDCEGCELRASSFGDDDGCDVLSVASCWWCVSCWSVSLWMWINSLPGWESLPGGSKTLQCVWSALSKIRSVF